MSDDDVHGIILLTPGGTNSTMFTNCCETAICNDQLRCPRCGDLIVGYDAPNNHERGRVRWRSATCFWRRSS